MLQQATPSFRNTIFWPIGKKIKFDSITILAPFCWSKAASQEFLVLFSSQCNDDGKSNCRHISSVRNFRSRRRLAFCESDHAQWKVESVQLCYFFENLKKQRYIVNSVVQHGWLSLRMICWCQPIFCAMLISVLFH